ncbi:MAG: 4'-phosphopantetheinyl transferase superfamily protein [Bacillota bacterium]|nr:4'-phosphopantetheinyl transferase superfamily protein [Bacillota bacterium]
MKIFVIRDYKARYPELKGRNLTDKLITDILLSCEKAARSPDSIRVVREPSGRPYIDWDIDKIPPYISVSHCGDVFACAVYDARVGLDIQNQRNIDTDRLARRYFSADEMNLDFYTVWTRKEALAKYTGRGIIQVMSGESVASRTDVRFTDFCMENGMTACVCTPAERGEISYEIQFFS